MKLYQTKAMRACFAARTFVRWKTGDLRRLARVHPFARSCRALTMAAMAEHPAHQSKLFSSFKLRDLEFKNRIWVSPMCQYSAEDGLANHWHLVHLGSRAVGGASLVMVEASAVTPEGRISPQDMGIWSAQHVKALQPIAKFIREQGAMAAIQLAHAGRKASTKQPWVKSDTSYVTPEHGGWLPLAPSAIPFDSKSPTPREMTREYIDETVDAFVAAAQRALEAGFQVAELPFAHGYLAHNFLSPLSNQRTDDYGGSFENRTRFAMRIVKAVRAVWPANQPLLVRISATDWAPEGGWDLEQSVALCRLLKEAGVDLVDCSSGGTLPSARIPVRPGYQVPFAEAIRKQVGIPTGAVGMITEPQQAEQIVAGGSADVVLLARELLRHPYWPLHAAAALGVDLEWPVQYQHAKPRAPRTPKLTL